MELRIGRLSSGVCLSSAYLNATLSTETREVLSRDTCGTQYTRKLGMWSVLLQVATLLGNSAFSYSSALS